MKIPKKINLAHLPTPLEILNYKGKSFLIKRDDYTGSDFIGNKIRKLEYLLYEAKKEKADIIFTCGGDQSNHSRAVASAAARLGFKTRLFLWGDSRKRKDGNLFLDKMYGSEISYLNKREFTYVDEIMMEERSKLITKGNNVYVIPTGGSSTLGIWGYISFIDELKKQTDLKKINGIYAACGSGGTAAGLLVGAALRKLKIKIYAVNVLLPEKEIRKRILQLAEGCILDYKLPCKLDENRLVIVDGYSSEGYKNIVEDKLKRIINFASSSGILLDPAYTGKAFVAYNDLVLNKNKGKRNIFIHTGGIFGVFPKRNNYLKMI
ncbi:MAG: pyridoxal-phosphate dependent enzyme [Ignavibacteriaceae bacterium]|nr:pyridoxal-phosphate dependent enzyme [Ignavibacteriaceae bacterium]